MSKVLQAEVLVATLAEVEMVRGHSFDIRDKFCLENTVEFQYIKKLIDFTYIVLNILG